MVIHHFDSVHPFLGAAGDFLLANETETFMVLGLASEMPEPLAAGSVLAVVMDKAGRVLACAIRKPPFPLILTRMSSEAVSLLVEDLAARGVDLAVMMAPVGTAEPFAELWAARKSLEAEAGYKQRAFALQKVEHGLGPRPGRLRVARGEDIERVTSWVEAFVDEVEVPMGQPRALAEAKIAQGSIFLWVDMVTSGDMVASGDMVPVTMAAWAGPTPNGVRLNLVYTPPGQRGRGYATSCVAGLSQHLLDQGKRYCFLFTDLANPTSNSIYQRIGYRPVFDQNEYRFC